MLRQFLASRVTLLSGPLQRLTAHGGRRTLMQLAQASAPRSLPAEVASRAPHLLAVPVQHAPAARTFLAAMRWASTEASAVGAAAGSHGASAAGVPATQTLDTAVQAASGATSVATASAAETLSNAARIEQLRAELARLEAAVSTSPTTETVVNAQEAIGAAWSPVTMVQYLIDYIHTAGHVPWWVAIVGATVLVRTALLPITLKVLRNSRRLANIQPDLQAVQGRISQAKAAGDTHAMMAAADELRALFAKHDASPWRSFLSILTMAPVYISFFMGLRRMAQHPEFWPGLTEGGFGWVTNLTVPDPYYVLPVLSAATMFATMELGAEGVRMDQMGQTMRNVFRVFAVLTVPLSAQFPAALLVYWSTSNLYSITQTMLLKVPAVRNLFNIPEVRPVSAAPAQALHATAQQRPAVLYTQKPKSKKDTDAPAPPPSPPSPPAAPTA